VEVETRDFRLWAGRKERRLIAVRIRELCRSMDLDCSIRPRRGILQGGLIIGVLGSTSQLDAFGEQYVALLEGRLDELLAERSGERTRR
jgi:hypothetical protein